MLIKSDLPWCLTNAHINREKPELKKCEHGCFITMAFDERGERSECEFAIRSTTTQAIHSGAIPAALK
jgi:hypothetical protein